MVEIEPVLVLELKKIPALAGFSVRGATDEEQSRTPVPAVEVGFVGFRYEDGNQTDVSLTVGWGVRLILERGSEAAKKAGALIRELIRTLHGFRPGLVEEQNWARLALRDVQTPDLVDQGLIQFVLIFETSAVYRGRQ